MLLDDSERLDLLLTMESFTGDLQVFALDGGIGILSVDSLMLRSRSLRCMDQVTSTRGAAPRSARPRLRPLLGAAALALLGVPGLATPPSPEISERALALARELRASVMGVDRAGNLWAWNDSSGRVEVYSPAGERLAYGSAGDAIAMDADYAAGIAAIVSAGSELWIAPWGEGKASSFRLPERSTSVAWIDAETLAVAPAMAGHRIEIWNLRDRTRLRTFGTETAFSLAPGLNRLRTLALHFDPARGWLYTVDGFTGEVQVFTLDGRLVRKVPGPALSRPELDQWIARVDREARAKGDVQSHAIWWLRPAVDAAGNVWLSLACDERQGPATLYRVAPDGSPSTFTVEERCCSRSIVIWGEWALLYASPLAPPSACNSLRRRP